MPENPSARSARTIHHKSEEVMMWQHLKIGVKNAVKHTLRIHFLWM